MNITVIGGGIGGLSAALFLNAAGHHVTVIEQAERFGAVGAGIQLSPNATRLLRHVDVLADVESVAVRPQLTKSRRWATGEVIGQASLGKDLEDRYGAPYLHVYRPDLIEVLARHVTHRLGSSVIRLGLLATSVDAATGTTHLSDGTTITSDVIVAADGIHSVGRTVVLGRQQSAQYSGHVAYRAVLPNVDPSTASGRLCSEADVNIWLGPGAHVVQYLLHREELVNLVIVMESNEAVPESWNEPADPDHMRQRFADWDPGLTHLLDRVETSMRWALHDHQPLPRWTKDRLCLLGDAAHPMLPYLAQGGAQAIEDGAVLADTLGIGATTADDLHTYEKRRLERTSAIQLAARAMGAQNHLPDGAEQAQRDERIREAGRRPTAGRLDIYGHDALRS
jgi:salicylate hydroxylase